MIPVREAEEISISPRKGRSKYRIIIEDILKYFEENSNVNVAKITYPLGADADKMSKKIRDWLKIDEEIVVIKKGRTVYFLRELSD